VTAQLFSTLQSVNRYWAGVVSALLQSQWACLDAGFRTANRLFEAASDLPSLTAFPPSPAPAPAAARELHQGEALVKAALERVGRGQPPPRELYKAPYRDQVDWLRFPAWARPSDPEATEGCVHEG
jgi:hypothetical protein